MFEKHLEIRTEQNDPVQIGIARWSIAKTFRFLGRVAEALDIQNELLRKARQDDKDSDGYIHEEIGECLVLLGRDDEARGYFARAWELLHEDRWLQQDEPQRLERLKRLGAVGNS
jgi:hypothetical protein